MPRQGDSVIELQELLPHLDGATTPRKAAEYSLHMACTQGFIGASANTAACATVDTVSVAWTGWTSRRQSG